MGVWMIATERLEIEPKPDEDLISHEGKFAEPEVWYYHNIDRTE